jgi:hypothetical protein
MRWRLRLVCGAVAEETADDKYLEADEAFEHSEQCPACGRKPSVIVDAEPIGLAGGKLGRPRGEADSSTQQWPQGFHESGEFRGRTLRWNAYLGERLGAGERHAGIGFELP